jgi:hypothetical protein
MPDASWRGPKDNRRSGVDQFTGGKKGFNPGW